MAQSPIAIERILFRFLNGEMALGDFEQWAYTADGLEAYLGEAPYLELIAFDFRQPHAAEEMIRLVRRYVDPGRYRTWCLRQSLASLQSEAADPAEALRTLYGLYCTGLAFLEPLALAYLQGLDDLPRLAERSLWDEQAFLQKRRALTSGLEPLQTEVTALLDALDTGELALRGEDSYKIQPALLKRLDQLRLERGRQRPPSPPAQPASPVPKPLPLAERPLLGKISYNADWNLTPRIKSRLQDLARYGVDIYSSRGDVDFTFMVPPQLTREEYEAVERLMADVSQAVRRKLNHIDWYPHGTKYRIEGPKGRRRPGSG